jgi:beta-phosphoglucomutase-like phosphatase (HAD superfamily)
VAVVRRTPGRFRAVIFDLDEALLASAVAWSYTVEEAVASVTGRRAEAAGLADEYRRRPWRHAISILVDSQAEIDECARLCPGIYERSAMKRLLVQEGIGMALDALRGASVEVGAISRLEHRVARKQIDSTGLDRFVTVLSATPGGESWAPAARIEDCLRFLGWSPGQCAYVACESRDLEAAASVGMSCFAAAWAGGEPGGPFPAISSPGSFHELLA